jgi:hypothetical protein
MSSHSDADSHAPRRRRRRLVVGGLLLVLVVLGLLAIPLLSVPQDARAARTDLMAAVDELRTGDVASARTSVARARRHVDAASDGTQGVGGDIWSRIPFLGTPVADARHLVQALDDATAVAEIGVELYPSVAGERVTLFRRQQIDRKTLDEVIAGADEARGHLASAEESLADVKATTPIVGDTIAAQRDAATARVTPAADTLTDLQPMLDELPAVLGFEGRRSYLIALLNPAELRYSGGAALSFAPMSWDQGAVVLGESQTPSATPGLQGQHSWRRITGNNFHRPDTSVANSTFAPSWSVSGEELLRAWRAALGKKHDGVLAVDVVALAQLLGATGSVTTPDYGKLTEGNLAETLVGSYDDYYPDAETQDAANAAVLPAFQERLFEGGQFLAKGRALGEAAAGRHFATYFRDEALQQGFATLGLDGDLAMPTGDYLAVATQNTNGSKADYWQRRDVSLDVSLSENGSAQNRLDVVVDNDSPPYEFPVPDPRTGYFTRWAGMALAVFLPEGVAVADASLGDTPFGPKVGNYYDHDFVTHPLLLEPSSQGRLQMDYTVPAAAEVGESGDLTYRLALDPQGTVIPASTAVTVHLPDGYRVLSPPEGWTARRATLRYRTDAQEVSEEWAIEIEASN